jgi:hypothetical protein
LQLIEEAFEEGDLAESWDEGALARPTAAVLTQPPFSRSRHSRNTLSRESGGKPPHSKKA